MDTSTTETGTNAINSQRFFEECRGNELQLRVTMWTNGFTVM